ncbi:MAG TPA: hypothetical protein PLX89_25060 [Verrucomicrobiota bacterium]|nr:hypothetical protein [Verrucomicrobiales bacterium]HRI16277.1 hypothetical protein [Verrucomicrobiota bacterium]
MQRRPNGWIRFAWGIALGGVLSLGATVGAIPGENPYSVITNRNAFGIRPPPEPEPPVVAPPPSAPPNIFLTGVFHREGRKKAYFVINRPGSKQPDYETAGEGEEFQDFKVLEINAKEGRVRALVSGREVSLNFADNGMKSTGGGGTGPGNPNVPKLPPGSPIPSPVAPVPLANVGGNSGPVVIGRGGVNLNSSQPAFNSTGAPSYAPVNPADTAGGGVQIPQITRNLPTRPGTDSPQPPQDQVIPTQTVLDPNSRSGIPVPIPPPSKYQ